MGLLDFLRKLLGGDDPLASPQQPRGPGYAPQAEHEVKPKAKRRARRLRLPPLRRERKASVSSRPARAKPYAMSRFGGAAYCDARVGGSPAQLSRFKLPVFDAPEELAAWLKVPLRKLAWLSDYHHNNAEADAQSKLSHYHYVWLKKRSGGFRLIEAPKPLLKAVQERILREILDHVPPHPAAHGFVKGRSIITNAAVHAGKYVIVKADLADFYPSVRQTRVVSIFRGMGYNLEMARWLARLCTNEAPAELRMPGEVDETIVPAALFRRHLPQGAPTSPALANLAAYGLDVRLSGLARKLGATYTRYADDLVFSGSEELLRKGQMAALLAFVKKIIGHERFALNTRKLRIIRRGDRQEVTGLSVNVKPNVPRPYFDTLKATLANCVRKGPAGQNRDAHDDFRAHLLGQIAFVRGVNPAKAARLQRMFERIQWS